MDVFDAVRTVLAVRQYQDKPLSADAVHRIVEAGHLSASSMNGQPWHFVVVQDRDTLQRLGQVLTTGREIVVSPAFTSDHTAFVGSIGFGLITPGSSPSC